jgi:hypothetical protein
MCLPDARNGIYMMKYALCCPDEFNQPATAFLLGFMQSTGLFLTEICNILKSLDQKKPQDVIVKFAGLGLILTVPKLIVPSMEDFVIQKAVGKLTLTRSRKDMIKNQDKYISVESQRLSCAWFFNVIYCIFKWFWHSFYFYFFPFVVVFLPLIKVTYLYKVNEDPITSVVA